MFAMRDLPRAKQQALKYGGAWVDVRRNSDGKIETYMEKMVPTRKGPKDIIVNRYQFDEDIHAAKWLRRYL